MKAQKQRAKKRQLKTLQKSNHHPIDFKASQRNLRGFFVRSQRYAIITYPNCQLMRFAHNTNILLIKQQIEAHNQEGKGKTMRTITIKTIAALFFTLAIGETILEQAASGRMRLVPLEASEFKSKRISGRLSAS